MLPSLSQSAGGRTALQWFAAAPWTQLGLGGATNPQQWGWRWGVWWGLQVLEGVVWCTDLSLSTDVGFEVHVLGPISVRGIGTLRDVCTSLLWGLSANPYKCTWDWDLQGLVYPSSMHHQHSPRSMHSIRTLRDVFTLGLWYLSSHS